MYAFTYENGAGNRFERNKHAALLRVWENHWKLAGFTPVICHQGTPSGQKETVDRLSAVFSRVTTANAREYTFGCLVRWVYAITAASKTPTEPLLCVDSDVLPLIQTRPDHPFFTTPTAVWRAESDFPTFLEPSHVPCAVMGSAKQLQNYVEGLIANLEAGARRVRGIMHASDQMTCQGPLRDQIPLSAEPVCRNLGEENPGERVALVHYSTHVLHTRFWGHDKAALISRHIQRHMV